MDHKNNIGVYIITLGQLGYRYIFAPLVYIFPLDIFAQLVVQIVIFSLVIELMVIANN
jgi:hypothetical protein